MRDDDEDGVCPWEATVNAHDGGGGGGGDAAAGEAVTAPRRRRGRPAHSRNKMRTHPLSEHNLSARDLTILRLGAKGFFDVQVDEMGHVILP